MNAPTFEFERSLLERDGVRVLACADEVGRGALCGPVSIAMVAVSADTAEPPAGLRDSKLLSPAARERLVPVIVDWADSWAVGHASAAEVDDVGIIAAMARAGRRAFAALDGVPDLVLLDGSHDYLGGATDLFDDAPALPCPVQTKVKADMQCAAVAAASILAKTTRDRLMVDLAVEYPDYGWDRNKGYASAEHVAALQRLGPTPHHRVSWRLPS